jgi:hypothetical protein
VTGEVFSLLVRRLSLGLLGAPRVDLSPKTAERVDFVALPDPRSDPLTL